MLTERPETCRPGAKRRAALGGWGTSWRGPRYEHYTGRDPGGPRPEVMGYGYSTRLAVRGRAHRDVSPLHPRRPHPIRPARNPSILGLAQGRKAPAAAAPPGRYRGLHRTAYSTRRTDPRVEASPQPARAG